MLTMIENLSTVGKALSAERELLPSPVLVSDVLRTGILDSQIKADLKGVELILGAENHNAVAFTDSTSLVRVVKTLIRNGIKYTPAGGSVTLTISSGGAEKWIVRVSDTGPGIDPEKLSVLFDIYVGTKKRGSGGELGSEIGLGICRQLMKKLKGSLEVESIPGKGATFILEFPAMVDDVTDSPSMQA